MKNLYYPAVFHSADEGGFWVTFPDLPECITEGDDMDEAYGMACDALGLAISDRLENKEEIPAASDFTDIDDDGMMVIIQLDLDAYHRKYNSRSVKKTLTIPEWLNEKALSMNINFSKVLQEALLEKVNM